MNTDTTTMTTTTTDAPEPTTEPRTGLRNGVDTTALFATLDVVKSDPEIAHFQFRAENTWLSGTHNRTVIHRFFGAKQEMEHREATVIEADHPTVLVGGDNAPTPVEYLLHAIAACITAGIANIAAARKVNLTEVSSTVEGDIDVMGLLGLDHDVRNGYSGIRLTFSMKGDDPEKLRTVLEQSVRRSAVYDVLTNGVPITIDVATD
ncbi:MAG: OsmC family peroxiredoxin [Agromyces sp.]|jgi:uncharacterized OsmC-like protein|nr:OsmC family peroxiredoxin [Agromyces sp.]